MDTTGRGIHRRLPIDANPALVARILERCKQSESGCLEWQGASGMKGHGRINYCGKLYSPHRVIYAANHGDIPPGRLVCHSCDNPRCVNPSHLFLGTYRDNVLDMHSKGRAAKPKVGINHEYATHTNEDVIMVRVLWLQGKSHRQIVIDTGFAKAFVQKVLCGEGWSHVETYKAEVEAKRMTNPWSIARRRRCKCN